MVANPRTKALSERNAIDYAILCEIEGIDPELPELIQQAEAEIASMPLSQKRRKPLSQRQTMFLEAAKPHYDLLKYLPAIKAKKKNHTLPPVHYAPSDRIRAYDLKILMEEYHGREWYNSQKLWRRTTHGLMTTFIDILGNYLERVRETPLESRYARLEQSLEEKAR
ncbi:hypothetical protein JW711_00850 [Candidatus Woesearchaeota archaeon]|nr:hypothetical protein [Candidatus Woesearchaeota archaeon]